MHDPNWRRKPKTKGMVHSDQGSQFTRREWQVFLGQRNPDASMRRRRKSHDTAVAESVFQLLRQKRIRRGTYLTCKAARQDAFARDVLQTDAQGHEQRHAVAR